MRRLLTLLAVLLLAPLATLPATATTIIERTLDELLQAAEIAFHGTVTGVEGRLLDGEPWTAVTFELLELLLDDDEEPVEGSELTLLFLGGSAEGAELSVDLMPVFEPGDEVLLLAYGERYYSPVVGFNQGLWYLDDAGNWIDQLGNRLSLDADGRLVRGDGETAAADEVTTEMRTRLELR